MQSKSKTNLFSKQENCEKSHHKAKPMENLHIVHAFKMNCLIYKAVIIAEKLTIVQK